MNFYNLPLDMQEEVKKLASQHKINVGEATKYYLMGGEHADHLCTLKDANIPDKIIEIENQFLWIKKNKKLWEELSKS